MGQQEHASLRSSSGDQTCCSLHKSPELGRNAGSESRIVGIAPSFSSMYVGATCTASRWHMYRDRKRWMLPHTVPSPKMKSMGERADGGGGDGCRAPAQTGRAHCTRVARREGNDDTRCCWALEKVCSPSEKQIRQLPPRLFRLAMSQSYAFRSPLC